MTKSTILSAIQGGVASVFLANAAVAQTTIDNTDYAQAVADHIISQCPANNTEAQNPEIVTACIAAGADLSYSIAEDMAEYISEVSIVTSPFWAGAANGDLAANCLGPMEVLGGRTYSKLENYLDAAFNAVRSCEESMARAGDAVELDFQPTARNTVACHMNRLKGYDCSQ